MWALLDIRTGRIGRLHFVVLEFLTNVLYKVHFLLAMGFYHSVTSDKAFNPYYFAVVCSLPFLYVHALVHVRRFRDSGITAWAALLGVAGQALIDALTIYALMSKSDGLSKWEIKKALQGLGIEPLIYLFGFLGIIYYLVLIFARSSTGTQEFKGRG